MSNRVLDRNLVENGTIVQFDSNGVSDGPLLGVVVIGGVGTILDAGNLSTEGINSRVGGSSVSATQGSAIGEDGGWKAVRTRIGRSTLRK